MDTRHLVDPELIPMLETFPALEFTPETLPMIRAGMAAVFEQGNTVAPDFPDIAVTNVLCPAQLKHPKCQLSSMYQKTPSSHSPRYSGFMAVVMCLVVPSRMIFKLRIS